MRIWLSFVALMLVAGPAQAFDCAKASTQVEKAICGDAALKSLDDRMSEAYGVVRRLSTEAERPCWRGRRRPGSVSATPTARRPKPASLPVSPT